MLKKLLLPLASSLLPASLAHALPGPAGGPQSLAVGYYEFPPYIYTDDDGSTQGEGAELIRKLLRQAGYRAELRALPSARLYQGLRDGSVQLWAGAPGKPELAESTLECEHVLGQVTLNLYRLASQPAPHLPQGLAGSRVILISGYSYWRPATQLLDDPGLNLEVHRTTTHNAALQMLLRDRGDYLLDYQAPVEEARNAAGLPPLAYDTLYRLPLKLIVSRRTPDAEQLRQRLDQAFEQLSAKGEKVELN
ncbi:MULTISPECIES: substrate-binding periplasmic protein [Pseudomonas]|uniref:substrate-binding periplasmic protein n=1 Tax=Pseudomonas TaxID=286 RepID=UPI000D6FCD35|nr:MULTISPECIES: transporter substrate-binding domain-containing protein [unclassified Pseudomonas]MED5612094.1 transporter substrate-binding domain-containing protein [Pseudomonas sp. JH-2]PWU29703.1 bifunctional lytic transglycosylase/amino acid ABC transporter substrate-binding protein [Pseudomonas sp. RW407]